jgi:EmrB/QacA subfamily drug resistance transporter
VTPRRVVVVFIALNLGMIMGTMDTTIVVTALPTIVRDIGGFDSVAWVVTTYLLVSVTSMPVYGKLGDLYGRRRIFFVAITLFLVGSLLCATAQTMGQLLGARAVQGLGGGGLSTVAMAIVADLVPARQLGRWLGYQGMIFAGAAVIGPLAGGLFVDHLDWRWAFLVNLPLGLLAIGIVTVTLRVPYERIDHAIDWSGSLLLTATLTAVVLLASLGGRQVSWASPVVLGLGALAVVLGWLFLAQERRAVEPVVPTHVLGDHVIRVAAGLNATSGVLLWCGIFFVPLFAQEVAGVSATSSGVVLIPLMMATALGTSVAGRRVERVGRLRWWPIAGSVVMCAGVLLLSLLRASTPVVVAAVASGVLGAGVGFVMQPSLLAMQNSVPPRDLGVATSTALLTRMLGSTIGTPIFGSILNARLDGRSSPSAFAHALPWVFLAAVPVALVSIWFAVRLPERPLREDARFAPAIDAA